MPVTTYPGVLSTVDVHVVLFLIKANDDLLAELAH